MEELFMDQNNQIKEELLKDFLKERKIVLNDTIDMCILEDVTLQIIKFNKEDQGLPREKRKPIYLYLQSPGGNVIHGFSLVDVIKASETPVYAVCFSNCSSMAFHLFIACEKRYAFKHSILLSHDGEISLANSSSKAKQTMKFFEQVDARTKEHVISNTKITSEFYDTIYDQEYYIYADEEGKNLGCVDLIIGEDVSIDEIL